MKLLPQALPLEGLVKSPGGFCGPFMSFTVRDAKSLGVQMRLAWSEGRSGHAYPDHFPKNLCGILDLAWQGGMSLEQHLPMMAVQIRGERSEPADKKRVARARPVQQWYNSLGFTVSALEAGDVRAAMLGLSNMSNAGWSPFAHQQREGRTTPERLKPSAIERIRKTVQSDNPGKSVAFWRSEIQRQVKKNGATVSLRSLRKTVHAGKRGRPRTRG